MDMEHLVEIKATGSPGFTQAEAQLICERAAAEIERVIALLGKSPKMLECSWGELVIASATVTISGAGTGANGINSE